MPLDDARNLLARLGEEELLAVANAIEQDAESKTELVIQVEEDVLTLSKLADLVEVEMATREGVCDDSM